MKYLNKNKLYFDLKKPNKTKSPYLSTKNPQHWIDLKYFSLV